VAIWQAGSGSKDRQAVRSLRSSTAQDRRSGVVLLPARAVPGRWPSPHDPADPLLTVACDNRYLGLLHEVTHAIEACGARTVGYQEKPRCISVRAYWTH